ncbi:tumor protein p53-inducible protein 11-like isoform X2 [Physella acuta]|uniref:tumor protein p53-inducible protein 11-like isoform X2 n=1 Tax=Physella acuta TaxID=109671 RepID=UPI0027DAF40D|nr:tumor protein p53-inducible protein 11-like isoform X2 [Physella acuta]
MMVWCEDCLLTCGDLKHSSGDLHSRLKTRKLLGVGETDDGDIHRSKLSQILGHSDQLYIRLPYGLRVWQLIMACMFTFIGTWALILPSHLFNTSLEGVDNITLPVRLYGGALISLSIVYWVTLSSQDRDIIRMCLLTSIVYFAIQFLVTTGYLLFSPNPLTRNAAMLLLGQGLFILVSWFYHWALVQRKFFSSMKRSASCKDLSKDK